MSISDWHSRAVLLEVRSTGPNGEGTDTVTVRALQSVDTDPQGREFIRIRLLPQNH